MIKSQENGQTSSNVLSQKSERTAGSLRPSTWRGSVFVLDSELLPCRLAGKGPSGSASSRPASTRCGLSPSASSPSRFAAEAQENTGLGFISSIDISKETKHSCLQYPLIKQDHMGSFLSIPLRSKHLQPHPLPRTLRPRCMSGFRIFRILGK